MTGAWRTPAAWRIPAAYVLALFAAVILAVAAFFKAGDPAMFAEQITAHQVTPASWSPFLAYFFIAAELGLAAALVAFVWPRLTLGLTILMMLGFIGVTAWAWAHGNVKSCGCFGRLLERGPQEVITEDALITIASLVAIWLLGGFKTRPWQWTVLAILFIPVLVLTGFGPALPIDAIVVGIKPGTDLADMAIVGLSKGIDEGRVLMALVDRNCPACDEGVASLKQIAADKIVAQVVAVCPGKPSTAQAWRLQHLPNFPIGSVPERILRQYYRRLPVTFLLEGGTVRRAWWNRIPTPDEVATVP